MNSYLVDDIDQVYDAHGNKHFVFAAASGACHPDGTDIAEPRVTLVVPQSRLAQMAELLRQLVDIEVSPDAAPSLEPIVTERLGGSIFVDTGSTTP